MPAHIMVSSDISLAIFDEEEGKTSFCDPYIVPWLLEPSSMRHEKPSLGEDGPPLQLVHLGRSVP